MLTADTITDEQILELALSDRSDAELQDLCDAAMSRVLAERAPERRRKYRASCADIANALAQKMPSMSCGCPIDAHSDTVNVGMGPGTGSTCGRGWPLVARALEGK